MQKIHGPILLGFGDMFVGAPPPRSTARGRTPTTPTTIKPGTITKPGTATRVGPKGAPAPGGSRVTTRRATGSGKPSPHKAATMSTISAGQKALDVAKKSVLVVTAYGKTKHVPAAKVAVTRVRGDGQVVLGVVAKGLTPKQKAAVAKHVKAIAKAAARNKSLKVAAEKAKVAGVKAQKVVKDALAVFKKRLDGKPVTVSVKGCDDIGACIGYIDEILGVVDEYGYDSESYADTGTTATTDAAVGPSSSIDADGRVLDSSGNVLYDPTTDPSVIPMPVRGQDLTDAEMSQQRFDHVPDDGIKYTTGVLAGNSFGSYGAFRGSPKNANNWGPGYIWGGSDWLYYDSEHPDTFKHGHFDSIAQLSMFSEKNGWGALVGNPDTDKKNLQFAVLDNALFWQGNNCPLTYAAEADSKITNLNQATISANQAAAVTEAARKAMIQASQDEDAAAEAAREALAESSAESTAQIADVQQQTQTSQLDIDTQKQQLTEQSLMAPITASQAQADVDYQKGQGQLDLSAQQAQQQAVVQQAAIWNSWAQQHPEEAVAQMAEGDDGGGEYDEGGDQGGQSISQGPSLDDADQGDMNDGSQMIDDGSSNMDDGSQVIDDGSMDEGGGDFGDEGFEE